MISYNVHKDDLAKVLSVSFVLHLKWAPECTLCIDHPWEEVADRFSTGGDQRGGMARGAGSCQEEELLDDHG